MSSTTYKRETKIDIAITGKEIGEVNDALDSNFIWLRKHVIG
jgi:hypothetical protein